ncbi:CDC5 cell division cycle 5-like protein [Physocladia obscura]|uniref:CDC5 cell division cycle 5-like protein n=1 Tax=Physocladia obscura TaxID=109957 RepID=A0AAD5XAV4_9FUNG|nr:CDC5 cell division cycle 5-like protein [Physocladia obscura]
MRILIKGGVWKNTEDEILKAAVMKYGKNQWARISSLLTRKTPKQCKARWFEWLDPSIKKTEWAKEEDEKLLHLAKLMPTQWRTIAPIVGRTPSQCLERYQWLLEEADTKEGEENDGPNADDVRRLRPGEIDPEPESKAARPDPVDMDEDEKEMLSEARARLANTQGKKAKRKAREKQLEEARRLASLQKRRELKAAGIETGFKPKKKRGMDYNADIPFQKRAPVGFFDISEEKEREAKERQKEQNIGALLSKLDGKRRSEIEEEERKKDAKKQKVSKEKGGYEPPKALRDAEDVANYQTSVRRSLLLPAPQVGDAEIEELVKIKSREEGAKSAVDYEDSSSVTNALLSEYKPSVMGPPTGSARTPLRTPATPSSDSLKVQARNLRAMEQMQTPLLGETVEFEGDDAYTYSGSTPRSTIAQTPNPLAAQLTPRAGNGGAGMTPRSEFGGSSRGGMTPRDEMGINTPMRESEGGFDETPRQRQSVMRQQLASLFKSLPAPQNNFKVVIPKTKKIDNADDEFANEIDEGERASIRVEDMEDVQARELKNASEEEKNRLLLRSTPVKRSLPRPLIYYPEVFEADNKISLPAEDLIRKEMERMLLHDMVYIPAPGQIPVPKILAQPAPADMEVTLAELSRANELILEELSHCRKNIETNIESLHESISAEYVFFEPTTADGSNGRFEKFSKTTAEERISNYSRQFELAKEAIKRDHMKALKLEKKLSITCGGYMARSTKLKRELAEVAQELEDGAISLESFKMVKGLEDVAIVDRIEGLKNEVSKLENREKLLQEKYQLLSERKDLLLQQGLLPLSDPMR